MRWTVPVAASWVAAAIVIGAPGIAWVMAGVCGGIGAAAMVVAWSCQALVRVATPVVVAGGLVMLVCVSAGVAWEHRRPAAVLALGDRVSATVRLGHDVTPSARSVQGTMLAVWTRHSRVDGIAVPVRLVPGGDTASAGSSVRVTGQLQADAPGSSVAFVLFVRQAPELVDGPHGIASVTARARRAFANATAYLPTPGSALLRGLAIGDSTDLDDATTEAMEAVSLSHLTAVSGSNCAVLAGIILGIARRLRWPRLVRVCAVLAALLAFLALVGPDPSIVRATVMAVTVFVVRTTGRPARSTPTLALATIAMLTVNPWYARSFAFALSVLATAGVVIIGPVLARLLDRWLWPSASLALAVPMAAQLVCWPVTVLLSPVLPTYSVPANLLAEPLAAVSTVAGLGACALAPVWMAGAKVLAAIAWVPAAGIAWIAHGTAALPFATLPWPEGLAGVVTAGLLGLLTIFVVICRATVRRLAVISGAVLLVCAGAVAVVPPAVTRFIAPKDWAIAACDIGQGDAVLVRDHDATALIDTGEQPDLLRSCLGLFQVHRIDLLILSHYDQDHVGAVDTVAGITSHALVGQPGGPDDDAVIAGLQAAGVVVSRGTAGVSGRLGTLDWKVLWPNADDEASGNDASVSVWFQPDRACGRCLSSVFLGDLEATAQRHLRTSAGAALSASAVDVVKVAHHGSANQDALLYRDIAAKAGIVSVGAGNSYGHPTARALGILADAGTTTLRTDLMGSIALSTSAQGVVAWSSGAREMVTPRASAAASRIGEVPEERTYGSEEARARGRRDPAGAVVRGATVAGRSRDRAGGIPCRARYQRAPRPPPRRRPCVGGT